MVEILHCDRCGVRMPLDRAPGEACSCGFVPERAPENAGPRRSSTRATPVHRGASRRATPRPQSNSAGSNAPVVVVAMATGFLVAVAAALLLMGRSEPETPVSVPTVLPEPAPDPAPAPAPDPAPALAPEPAPAAIDARTPAEPVPATPPAPAPAPAPAPVADGGGTDDGDFFAKLRADSEKRRPKWVGRWRPAEMSKAWKPMKWDVTECLKSPGRFGVTFSYTKGRHRLDIQWAALLEDGREVSRDAHHGMTGGKSTANTYTLDLANLRPGSRYVLHASVRSGGGTDSNGEIRLRDLPPEGAR